MLSSKDAGGYPCIACRANNDAPDLGGVCPSCAKVSAEWDSPDPAYTRPNHWELSLEPDTTDRWAENNPVPPQYGGPGERG